MIVREIADVNEMVALGERLGAAFRGGECLELIGDVGAGKTTFTKGIGKGLRIDDDVQSPSFTISRVYGARDNLTLQHYDFYRLTEPGVMSFELAESLADPSAITVIEWAETVADVLPHDHISVEFRYHANDEGRTCRIYLSEKYHYLEGAIQ